MSFKKDDNGLTPLQMRFCSEYLKHFNATKAAKDAGYKGNNEGTIRSTASELLAKPNVANYIANLRDQQLAEINKENVLTKICELATANPKDIFNADGTMKAMDQLTDAQARTISNIEVIEYFEGRGKEREQVGVIKKIKFWDKPKSLEMLAKHLKLLVDRVDVSGSVTLEGLVAPDDDAIDVSSETYVTSDTKASESGSQEIDTGVSDSAQENTPIKILEKNTET